MCNDTDVGDVINYLFALSEGVEVYFSSGLYPFEEEMWGELLLVPHDRIIIHLGEELRHQLAVVTLTHKYLTLVYLLTLLQVYIIERGIGED